MNKMSEKQASWERIFRVCKVVERVNRESSILISSDEINKALIDVPKSSGSNEIRLLVAYATKKGDVSPFVENGLALLPYRGNDEWVIGRFHTFEKLPYDENLEKRHPTNIERLKKCELIWRWSHPFTSEGQVEAFAYASGAVSDIVGDTGLVQSFGSKKRITESLSYCINKASGGTYELKAKGIPIEVDRVYESSVTAVVSEFKAKKDAVFNVKQLFYVYAHAFNKLKENGFNKDFFGLVGTYCPVNTNLYLFLYKFTTPNNFSSLCLLDKRIYRVYRPSN